MSTAKTKKTMRRRQRGPLQRQNGRRSVRDGVTARRSRSASDGAGAIASSGASSTSGSSTTSLRLSSPATLTRSQGTRNLPAGRSEARSSRADAAASKTSASSPQVAKRDTLKRQNAMRDRSSAPAQPMTQPAKSVGKPKRDFATGRTLFPVESGGKTQYVPLASEATSLEVKNGAFIADAAVQKDPVNTLADRTTVKPASLRDFASGRTVFATETTDGSTEYLPKRSEATAVELSQGRYVNDEKVSAKSPLGAENAMSNLPSKYDLGKGRKVYAVNTPEGKTIYLPREGEANGQELAKGLFIPDDIVAQHESKRRRTALRDDAANVAQRRAQRATKLPAGVNRRSSSAAPIPVHKAKDGTELWDGFTPPQVSEEKQRETLKSLKPKYDIGKGRMLYPTETAQGKVEYLPLFKDASAEERFLGLYAAFVPSEPLEDFLANAETQSQIARQTFASNRGNVKAYSQEDIDTLFDQPPTLVLRSAQLVSDTARQILQLQQQFNGV